MLFFDLPLYQIKKMRFRLCGEERGRKTERKIRKERERERKREGGGGGKGKKGKRRGGVGCRYGLNPTLLWLWHRLVATAPIQLLAWELHMLQVWP